MRRDRIKLCDGHVLVMAVGFLMSFIWLEVLTVLAVSAFTK
jgi:hypothetical protein